MAFLVRRQARPGLGFRASYDIGPNIGAFIIRTGF